MQFISKHCGGGYSILLIFNYCLDYYIRLYFCNQV